MRTLSIGRGEGCDIFIDDYRISRRHALLKIYPFGKMEIVDLGQNGTWVNGVKLRPNVPFPVKRRDVINFAEASRLNWNHVPNPLKPYKIGAAIMGIVVAIVIVIFTVLKVFSCLSSSNTNQIEPIVEESGNNSVLIKDSVSAGKGNEITVPSQQTKKKDDDVTNKTVNELFPPKKVKTKDKKKEGEKVKKKEQKDEADDSSTDPFDENNTYDIL